MNKFYHFPQNNSGGRFVINDEANVHVIIEAADANEANQIAQEKGIYFDGVSAGRDCECCGDRWHEVSECDGTDFSACYGKRVDIGEKDVVIHRKIS